MTELSVVIPVYNEEESLNPLWIELYRGFLRFIPTLLKIRGYRVIEVPVSHRPRRFGQSKYGIMNRAFVVFADLLVVRWMKSRLLRYKIAEDLGGDLVRG